MTRGSKFSYPEDVILRAIDTYDLQNVKDSLGTDVGVGADSISAAVLIYALNVAESQSTPTTKAIFDFLYNSADKPVKDEFHNLGFNYPSYSSGKGRRQSKTRKTRKGKSKKARKTRGRRRA